MAPKVSVLIPVYNSERYLEKCLDSILNQTLAPREIEVICVDDGSTDSSPEILDRYAAAHACLRTIHQANAGQSCARNAAMDVASGEYILFVDSDDWLLRPDVIEALYVRAAGQRLDELIFDTEVFYEDDDIHAQHSDFERHYARNSNYPDVLDGPGMLELLCRNRDYVCTVWSRLYRRAFLEENRLRFYPGIIHQDEAFSLECMSLEKRVGYCQRAYYGRYVHALSVMTSSKLSHSAQCYLICAWAMRQFERERLSGAGDSLLRSYRRRIRVMIELAANQYLSLPARERGAVYEGRGAIERWRMRRMLWGELLRRRKRELTRALRGRR